MIKGGKAAGLNPQKIVAAVKRKKFIVIVDGYQKQVGCVGAFPCLLK